MLDLDSHEHGDPEKMLFPFRKALIGLGVFITLAGVALLLYFAYMTYQIFNEPGQVRIVQYVLELIQRPNPVIEGSLTVQTPQGPSDMDFSVKMSEEIKTIIFIFLGGIAFSICVGISTTVVNAGVSIIKGAMYKGDTVNK